MQQKPLPGLSPDMYQSIKMACGHIERHALNGSQHLQQRFIRTCRYRRLCSSCYRRKNLEESKTLGLHLVIHGHRDNGLSWLSVDVKSRYHAHKATLKSAGFGFGPHLHWCGNTWQTKMGWRRSFGGAIETGHSQRNRQIVEEPAFLIRALIQSGTLRDIANVEFTLSKQSPSLVLLVDLVRSAIQDFNKENSGTKPI
jgi:hypothetical protein